jgi:hypothetical protein
MLKCFYWWFLFGGNMANKLNWYHNKDLKLSAYEEMTGGTSYIEITYNDEIVRIPTHVWRLLNTAWYEKKWDESFDTLACTDHCFVDGDI